MHLSGIEKFATKDKSIVLREDWVDILIKKGRKWKISMEESFTIDMVNFHDILTVYIV